jgi:hypothetical protein
MSRPDLPRRLGGLGAAALFALATPVPCHQQDQPGELGEVQWNRSEPTARLTAKATGKPLLILFQEVPG